jgi:histone H1/5
MKRVLILDDDTNQASHLADRLVGLGFQAVTADTPQRAVEEMQSGGVAVLVAGPLAGGRPGIDMIKLARQVSPGTRSLLLGVEATAREYKVAIEHGAVDVLTSPFTERDLVHAVRKALECEQGFHGRIHGLGLVDLLQMVHYSRRSLVIQLGPEASIHMYRGDIVHAVAPPLFGREALQKLLAERSGSLSTAPFETCAHTINTPFEPLLLDVLCQIDEIAEPEDTPPPPFETTPLPPPFASARPVTVWSRMWPIFILAALVGVGLAGLSLFMLAPRADTERALKAPPEISRPGPVAEPLADDDPAPALTPQPVVPSERARKPVVVRKSSEPAGKKKNRGPAGVGGGSDKTASTGDRTRIEAKAERPSPAEPVLRAAVDSAVRDLPAPDVATRPSRKPTKPTKPTTKKKPAPAKKSAPKKKPAVKKAAAKKPALEKVVLEKPALEKPRPKIGTVGNSRQPDIGTLD